MHFLLRVAFISPEFYPKIGGIEVRLYELATRLVKKGVEVDVITTDYSGNLPSKEEINGVAVRRYRSSGPKSAYVLSSPQIYGAVKHCNADIMDVQSFQAFSSFAALLGKRKTQPLVFTPHYHGRSYSVERNILLRFYRSIMHSVLQVPSRIICVSPYEQHLFEKHFSEAVGRTVVLPNAIDWTQISNRHWKPPSESKILYVGRLEKQKNFDKLLKAFDILVNEKKYDATLTAVGLGSYESTAKQYIQKANLQGRVVFKSNLQQSELFDEYQSASLCVMPSELEAFNMVVAEAIAVGTPTLVANTSALSDFVNNGLSVGIAPPITPQRICESMLSVLASPNLANYSKRDLAEQRLYSWDEVSEGILKIYHSVLENDYSMPFSSVPL
ncbi:MAG: glycosyltransferase family 4 protein [Candidatus Bathyarchaeota archaeon]|nr:glycosyltransferase family 4 protein [Candidatus Bathyarchaeota archaeon]